MRWVRLGLLLGIVGLVALALGHTQAPPSAAPVSEPPPSTPRPEPSATRVPLPTVGPQMIVSRVVRETPLARPTATPASELRVSLVDNGYVPTQMTIRPGARVVWVNAGGDGHDVTGTGPGGVWRSGPLAPAEQYQRQFSIAGTYDYQCSVHPEMRGRIVVQP